MDGTSFKTVYQIILSLTKVLTMNGIPRKIPGRNSKRNHRHHHLINIRISTIIGTPHCIPRSIASGRKWPVYVTDIRKVDLIRRRSASLHINRLFWLPTLASMDKFGQFLNPQWLAFLIVGRLERKWTTWHCFMGFRFSCLQSYRWWLAFICWILA